MDSKNLATVSAGQCKPDDDLVISLDDIVCRYAGVRNGSPESQVVALDATMPGPILLYP